MGRNTGIHRGPFTDEILTRCEEVMRNVCADFETELVEFNDERDHVHAATAPLSIINDYIEQQKYSS